MAVKYYKTRAKRQLKFLRSIYEGDRDMGWGMEENRLIAATRVWDGETRVAVARDMGLSPTTIGNYVRDLEKIYDGRA